MPTGPENHPGEYERRVPAGGARSVEDDLLANLARRLAPTRGSSQAKAVSDGDRWGKDRVQSLEKARPHPMTALIPSKPSGSAATDPCNAGPATAWRWRLKANSALAFAGAALLGATLLCAVLVISVFGPKGGSTGAQPFIAGSQRTEARQPSGETVATQNEIDATRWSHITLPDLERPASFDADASPAATPQPVPPEPPPTGVAPPISVRPPAAAPAAPVAAADIAALPPGASQSAESNPSAPADATTAPSAIDGEKAASRDAPQQPIEAAPMAESNVVAVAQPTPMRDLPAKFSRAKLSKKIPARVMAAKTGVTAPDAAAANRRQPQPSSVSMTSLVTAEPQAAPSPAAARAPVNPVTHAGRAPEAPAVDQTGSAPGDWAIQFAAPKSTAEAELAAARLNAKYAGALNGATIAVHKTQVNGETIYSLRVAGLSKTDAAALCVRVKGRDCSIIK